MEDETSTGSSWGTRRGWGQKKCSDTQQHLFFKDCWVQSDNTLIKCIVQYKNVVFIMHIISGQFLLMSQLLCDFICKVEHFDWEEAEHLTYPKDVIWSLWSLLRQSHQENNTVPPRWTVAPCKCPTCTIIYFGGLACVTISWIEYLWGNEQV